MDVTDANPFGRRPPKRPDPLVQEPREEAPDAGREESKNQPTVWPWRREQPDMFRLRTHTIDLDARLPQYEVVNIARDIVDDSRHAVIAQANVDSRNAMALIMPGVMG